MDVGDKAKRTKCTNRIEIYDIDIKLYLFPWNPCISFLICYWIDGQSIKSRKRYYYLMVCGHLVKKCFAIVQSCVVWEIIWYWHTKKNEKEYLDFDIFLMTCTSSVWAWSVVYDT